MKTHWLFTEFLTQDDYQNGSPFAYKLFDDFNKMKEFGATESARWKPAYPDYCSTYRKLESWDNADCYKK